jgi:branched-chain amino acid transport system substrate-binding protein
LDTITLSSEIFIFTNPERIDDELRWVNMSKTSRRDVLKIGGAAAAGLVVGGVGGWYSSQVFAPAGGAGPRLSGEIPIGILHASPVEVTPEAPAIDMAFEDINNFVQQFNMDVKFVPIKENAEESSTKAVERTQTLIERGCQVIIGPEWSGILQAIMPLVNERKVVVISQSSSSPRLAIAGDYVYRLQPDDTHQAVAIRRITTELGIKAVIVMYGREAYAEGLWRETEPKWKEAGIEIIEALGVDPEKRDFRGELSVLDGKFKEARSKYTKDEIGVFIWANTAASVAAFSNLSDFPDLMSARVFDADAGGLPAYATEVGAKARLTAYAFGPPASPKYIEWSERYKAITGYEKPYFTAVNIYDSIWIGALSVLTAGTYKGDVVAKVVPIVASSYFGVSGWCILNDAGDRKYATYDIMQVVMEGGTPTWKTIGFYDESTDKITWY